MSAGTVYYLSPLCPDLTTRVWLEFVGLPPRLWPGRSAGAATAKFGAVAGLDAAPFRRAGRAVVEARVTRVGAVPQGLVVTEVPIHLHAGAGWAQPPRPPRRPRLRASRKKKASGSRGRRRRTRCRSAAVHQAALLAAAGCRECMSRRGTKLRLDLYLISRSDC
ncbi:hypothetical protein ACP70R_019280 [Stipagrostis hirtigluma subsp. patula]